MNNSQSNKETKKQNKTWLVIYVIVGLILVVGVVLFLSPGKKDPDSFPELTLESGATLKGQFSDPSGFWQYEADDSCQYTDGLTANTLKAGQSYYYAQEDLTIQQIKERINCIPFNRIRVIYLDPVSQNFYSWPEAAHNETEKWTDETLVVKAFTPFIIQSKDAPQMGGIFDLENSTQFVSNPFAQGAMFDYINNLQEGWVAIAGVNSGAELVGYLNDTTIGDRVEKLYYKDGLDINDFDVVTITQGSPIPDFTFPTADKMVWMKLGLAPEEPQPTPGDFCGGEEDGMHACLSDGVSGVVACAELGMDCVYIQERTKEEGSQWSPVFEGNQQCGNTTITTNFPDKYFRALCEEPPEDCGGNDPTHICLTDGGGQIEYYSGEGACQSELGLSCLDIEAYCGDDLGQISAHSSDYDNNWDGNFTLTSDFNNLKLFDTNDFECNETFDPADDTTICLWRASCGEEPEPEYVNYCDSDDESDYHRCIETSGDAACADIGKTCMGLAINNESDPNTDYDYVFGDGGCDKTVESINNQVSEGNWEIRALCCEYADETHACITGARDRYLQNYADVALHLHYYLDPISTGEIINTGNEACGIMGKTCTGIEVNTQPLNNTTWSLENIQCDQRIQDYLQQKEEHPSWGIVYPYSVRAVCQ